MNKNGHNENEVRPTPEDYQRLWLENPMAFHQLRAIVMERLYKETIEKLEATQATQGKDV